MAERAASRHRPIPRGVLLWIFGLGVGLVGGYATLTVSPVAAVPALVLWVCLAVPSPRFLGLAGALLGHGAVWAWLLVTSNLVCASYCSWSLTYGPAHLTDAAAWQTETRIWFAFALGLFAIGAVLTAWTVHRVRQGLRERPEAPTSAGTASTALQLQGEIRVREFITGDGPALRALWQASGFRLFGDDDAGLERVARRNPGLFLVATVDGVPVASAIGTWDGRRGWLYHVATAPAFRRRGIGARLAGEVEAGLRGLGCRKVNLLVFEANAQAMAFWRALGYTRAATVEFTKELGKDDTLADRP